MSWGYDKKALWVDTATNALKLGNEVVINTWTKSGKIEHEFGDGSNICRTMRCRKSLQIIKRNCKKALLQLRALARENQRKNRGVADRAKITYLWIFGFSARTPASRETVALQNSWQSPRA